MNRKEARRLYLLAQFGIFKVNLKPGRIHVLGDALSRAPHIMEQQDIRIRKMEASHITFRLNFKDQYVNDQFFGPIV